MSNIYNVGMALTLHNNVSPALGIISKQMMGMHGTVNQLQNGFNNLKMGIWGAFAGIAGGTIVKGVMHLEKAAEALVHAETALKAGLPTMRDGSPVDRAIEMRIAQTAAYKEAGDNLNTTLTENIEHIHDLYNVVVDMKHAAELLPTFNTLANAFTFSRDGRASGHGNDAKEIANAARAFELTGRTTRESMEQIAHAYVASVIALRGRVTGTDLLQAVSNAGASRYGWSDDFVTTTLPSLVNVMKGRMNAGIGLYHMMNNLYGGVASSKAQAAYQEKWGLHTEDQEMRDPVTGKFQGFKVGSLWHANQLADQPLVWANEYRKMLSTKFHVNVDDLKTMRDIVQEIGRGNKSLSGILDELLLPNPNRQFNKERGNIMGIDKDALADAKKTDPKMWRDAYAKQMENLEEALGKGVVPMFIDNFLKPLTLAFRDLSQWALRHPLRTEYIMKALTVLGVGLAIIGTALVAVAVVAAVIGAPITAIVAIVMALGVAVVTYWSDIVGFFSYIWHWVSKIWGGSGSAGTYEESVSRKTAEESQIAADARQKKFRENLEGGLQSYRAQFGIDGVVKGVSDNLAGSIDRLRGTAPPPGKAQSVKVETTINLDSRVLARAVTEEQVRGSTFPPSVGAADGRGSWQSPGALYGP